MQESLLQKAQRLGIKPAATPVASTSESLLQKAQRLGIQPAKPKAPEETYGAFVPAKSTDNPLVAGGKALANVPSSAFNLGKGILSAAANVFNPDLEKNTVANIGKTIIGAGETLGDKYQQFKNPEYKPEESDNERLFKAFTNSIKERYGSLENLQKTATNDPFGFGTDIVSLVAGGAGLVGKEAQVSNTLSKVANPIVKPLEKAASVAGDIKNAAIPKLLSYTSDVPEAAFKTMLERREPVTQAIKTGTTPEMALSSTRNAVRTFRKQLSSEWDEGVNSLIKENTGNRLGLPDKVKSKFESVADEFGIDLPPGTNLGNLSVKETVNILKKLNELPKAVLTFSPKGAVVRELKSTLKNLAVKNFGGDAGAFDNFYKNYSSKKSVLDAANDIVNAYAEGKPIKDTTALNRLQNIFDENKPAYLQAILDLEKSSGIDILSNITASKFKPIAPSSFNKLSAAGGMATPKGIIERMARLLAFPLTSPRASGAIARNIRVPEGVATAASEINNFKVPKSFANLVEKYSAKFNAGLSVRALTPENVARRVDATDVKLIKNYLEKKDPNSYIEAQAMIEAMGLKGMEESLVRRFLQEVIDLKGGSKTTKRVLIPKSVNYSR